MRRRVRLNVDQKKRLYNRLVKMKGKYCWVCGNTRKELVVDCIYNDDDYTTPGKQQLLCRSCNSAKNPRGKGRFNPERSISTDDMEVKRILSMEFETNRKAEPEFISWLYRMVTMQGEITVRDAKNAGAMYVSEKIVSISQQTIARYIDKQTSATGRFMIEDRSPDEAVIRFRPRSAPPPAPVDDKEVARGLIDDGHP